MIFNMVGGASGGGGEAYAAISVTYPAGSICTCSNGSKTLKATDTSGSFLFLVPEGGEWTVSITDGTKQVSKTVSITEKYQSATVNLINVYIFDNGIVNPYSFSVATYGSDVSTQTELGIASSYNSTSGHAGTLASTLGITIPEGYTKLCFSVRTESTDKPAYCGLMLKRQTISKTVDSNTVALASTSNNAYSLVTIDVSALIGQVLYIAFGNRGYASSRIWVNQIYFAP